MQETLKALLIHTNKNDIRDFCQQPFFQDGYVYATDAHTLIRMNPKDVNGDFETFVKPVIKNIFKPDNALEFNESLAVQHLIDVTTKSGVLIDEFKHDPEICDVCKGSGEVTCNFGHDHDCDNCEGDGEIQHPEKTGKQIINPEQLFVLWGKAFKYKILKRVIDTAVLLKANKVHLTYINSDVYSSHISLRIGKSKLLVMPVAAEGEIPKNSMPKIK